MKKTQTFALRVDMELYERLKATAEAERRSINSAIILAVESWLRTKEDTQPDTKPNSDTANQST